jgi:dihydroorotate dehydrogenase electron transfer subunit
MGGAPLAFLANSLSGKAGMTAIIGARNADGVLCVGAFRAARAKVSICTEDGSRGQRGLVTGLLETALEKSNAVTVFACGPGGMLRRTAQICAEYKTPCWVSMEERMACGIGVCLCCPVPVVSGGYKSACKDGPVFNAREVNWHGFK